MTQPDIHVNNYNLGGELDDLRAIVAQMDSALDQFEQFVQPRLASWTGDAQAQYRTAKAQWDQQIARVGASLNGVPATFSEIADYHVIADKYSAQGFG
jgi:uncharacterized protein YukE